MAPKTLVPKPAAIRRSKAIVEGGLLNGRPWLVQPQDIFGKEFVKLGRKDRDLCKFLGLDSSKPRPMQGARWLAQLSRLRNLEVDRLIELNKPQDSRGPLRMRALLASVCVCGDGCMWDRKWESRVMGQA